MYSHSEPIEAGTQLRSLLTDAEYIVVDDYDPDAIRRQATVTIAPLHHPEQSFSIMADRIEQDFHTVETENTNL